MTDKKRHALAHDWPLQVPLSDEADAALRGVVEAHLDAFDAALEPFGLSMSDVLLPTWMRAVYIEDVVAFAIPDYGKATTDLLERMRAAHEEPPAEEDSSAEERDLVGAIDSPPVISPEQRAAFEGARIVSSFDSISDGCSTISPSILAKADAAAERMIAEGIMGGGEPPLRGDLEGSVPTRDLLPLGRQDDCSSGEACGAQCSAATSEPRVVRGPVFGEGAPEVQAKGGYCSAFREADGLSCLFREGHTGAHDFSRLRAPGWGSGRVAESEAYRAAVRAEAALERGDRG